MHVPSTLHSEKSILTVRTRTRGAFEQDTLTTRVFQAMLGYRSSQNRSQFCSSSTTAKAIPQNQNGFLRSPTDALEKKPDKLDNIHSDALIAGGEDRSSLQTSPLQIAHQFAEKAVCVLSPKEVEYLIHFLQEPQQIDPENVRRVVQSRLNAFCQAEVATTGEPLHRLAAPSGPEDGALGIILHCQSKEGRIGGFWDLESPTIQTLAAKGLKPDFVYGFDWHWRAEESARRPGRSNCPASSWTAVKRSLHDGLSADILEILPLPWLIVGGSCTKGSYRRTLSPHSRLIALPLSPTIDLQFELDIRENGIKRIATYVPHPSSGFFHPSFSLAYAAILDSSINFFLWLQFKEGIPYLFTSMKSGIVRGIPGAAPLQELYQYRQREEVLGRKLTEEEYQPPFLIWAAKYLSERPSIVLDRGDSLANVIIKKLGRAISEKATYRRLNGYEPSPALNSAGRKSAASRYGHSFKNLWDGEPVSVTKKGIFKIFLSENRPSLELNGKKSLRELVARSPEPVTIHFSSGIIILKQCGEVVFQQTCSNIKDPEQRERWIEQVRVECSAKELNGI